MSKVYQMQGFDAIDYHLCSLPGLGGHFRGPYPGELIDNQFVACVGAAQTFGVFCRFPFPAQLEERIGLRCVNMGIGGAGPEAFFRPPHLALINRSRLAIVQVMSARCVSNSEFVHPGGFSNGRRRSHPDSPLEQASELWGRYIAENSKEKVISLVGESRANWVEWYKKLLASITVPKILFWFSERKPEEKSGGDDTRSFNTLSGGYPHFVNRDMLEALRPCVDSVVECSTPKGMPQVVYSRFKPARARIELPGKVTDTNWYYPSPHMHSAATEILEDSVKALLDNAERSRAKA